MINVTFTSSTCVKAAENNSQYSSIETVYDLCGDVTTEEGGIKRSGAGRFDL